MPHEPTKTDWVRSFYHAAAGWWGESWYDGENLQARLDLLRRCLRPGKTHLLELGAGTGETALYLAKHGYTVTAVDLCQANIAMIRKTGHPAVRAVEGNFLDVPLAEQFDAVCLFETFGMGTDADQRRLLRRIRQEWLAEDGAAVVDVYHPLGPIRRMGKKVRLDRLAHVPGSVEMNEISDYDGFNGRWIDTWEPVAHPEMQQAQSIRCYTPADLLLLLEGTGLKLARLFFGGVEVMLEDARVRMHTPFEDIDTSYAYTVLLVPEYNNSREEGNAR